MARNTQQFNIDGQVITVLCAQRENEQGQNDLAQCLDEIRRDHDPVAKFQKSANILSQFFKPKTVDKSADMQAILYRNGAQQSLIMTNGSDHYFYDLTKGAAATFDVKEVLGQHYVDVSGNESREYMHKMNNDVGRVREIMAGRLTHNISTAISYALHQIKEAQKHPELTRGMTPPMRG